MIVDIIYDSNTLEGEALSLFNQVHVFAERELTQSERDRLYVSDPSGRSVALSNPCLFPLSQLINLNNFF
jgi:hypothetical protein